MQHLKRYKYFYVLASIIVLGVVAWQLQRSLTFNVTGQKQFVYVRTNSSYKDLVAQLEEQNLISNQTVFNMVATVLGLKKTFKAGRYIVRQGSHYYDLISDIKNGKQALVALRLDNVRTKQELAKLLADNLELDYETALKGLEQVSLAEDNLRGDACLCMFIADTYLFAWNTTMASFLTTMEKKYKETWNQARRTKAKAINMAPPTICILASIVYKEVAKDKELPVVAGLYINRLRRGMPLAADPTIIFANKMFGLKRVRYKHLRVNSPYNTYLHKGLPPGPITLVPIKALDAVLDYAKHNYLYMCAKASLNGEHDFARTFAEHQKNARALRKKLDLLNIKK